MARAPVAVFIFIENHSQLVRIQPEEIAKLVEDLVAIAVENRGREFVRSKGELIFHFPLNEDGNVAPLNRALEQLLDRLKETAKKLRGFTLIADAVDESSVEESLSFFRSLYLQTDCDDTLWFSYRISAAFQPQVEMEDRGALFLWTGFKQGGGRVLLPDDFMIERRVVLQSFLDLIEEPLNSQSGPFYVLVRGAAHCGKSFFLSEALKALGYDDAAPCPVFGSRRPLPHGLNVFRDRLSPLLSVAEPEGLHAAERELWTEKTALLHPESGADSYSDTPLFLKIDMISTLHLLLKIVRNSARRRFRPPVLVCENADLWQDGAWNLLRRVLRQLPKDEGFFLFLESRTGETPAFLADWSGAEFAIPPLSTAEIESFAEAFDQDEERKVLVAAFHASEGHPASFRYGVLANEALSEASDAQKAPESRPKPEESVLPRVARFASHLSSDRQRVLYTFLLSGNRLPIDLLLDACAATVPDRREIDEAVAYLKRVCLLFPGDGAPVYPELLGPLESALGEKASSWREGLLHVVTAAWDKGSLKASAGLLDFLKERGCIDRALLVLFRILVARSPFDEEFILRFIKRKDEIFHLPMRRKERLFLFRIYLFSQLREAIRRKRLKKMKDLIKTVQSEQETAEDFLSGHLSILLSRYCQFTNEQNSALEYAKQANIWFQDRTDAIGTIHAQIQLGTVMLSLQRLSEAGEYFDQASAGAEQIASLRLQLDALVLKATKCFLADEHTDAQDAIRHALGFIPRLGCRKQETLLRFLQARVFFRLGRYEEAVVAVEHALAVAVLYRIHSTRTLLSAWLGRCLVYSGLRVEGSRILQKLERTPEKEFFSAEALAFDGDWQGAVRLLDKMLADPLVDEWNEQRSDWKTGFSLVENSCLPWPAGYNLLRRLGRAFRAHLHGQYADSIDDQRELFSLTHDERPAESDPYTGFYYYFYAAILPERRGDSINDYLTELNKALGFIRKRSSRIVDPQERRDFLEKNHWNSVIMGVARKRKLV